MVSGSIAAGVAVGSAIFGSKQQKKAGKRARKLAMAQADVERKELEESLRRLDIQQEQQTGQQVAAAGATGFDITRGSVAKFLQQQREQRSQEREFADLQGRRRINLMEMGAQNVKAAADARAMSTLVSGFGQAAVSLSGGAVELQQAQTANPNTRWWQV